MIDLKQAIDAHDLGGGITRWFFRPFDGRLGEFVDMDDEGRVLHMGTYITEEKNEPASTNE